MKFMTDNTQTWATQPSWGCVWAIENIGLTANHDLQVQQSRWKSYLAQKKHKKTPLYSQKIEIYVKLLQFCS